MIYTLPVRDPEIGYRDTWLWLPKSKISVDVIKRSLVIPVMLRDEMTYLYLWKDSPNHLGVPREKIDPSDLPYPVIDLTPKSYKRIPFKSRITLDYIRPDKEDQKNAYRDLSASRSGILNLSCGKGKTVISLHHIAERQVPALVINDKVHILKQWMKEAKQFLEIPGEIGWIQGPPDKWTWDRPLVFASLTTLAKYVEFIPPAMACHFGGVYWDEIHHLSADSFSLTADAFFGDRFGMTATWERDDGSEMVYLWHVGKIVHSNLTQDVIPDVTFIRSPTILNMSDPEAFQAVTDKRGEIHIRKLSAYVGQLPEEVEFAKSVIDEGVKRGKDMLCVTLSKDHARLLHQHYYGSGILDADVKAEERLSTIQNKRLTFATVDMAKEALNKRSLDTLIILTEFSSKNMLQQAMGRIQRFLDDKGKTRVIVIYHHKIGPMKAMGRKLMSHFRKWGIKVRVK